MTGLQQVIWDDRFGKEPTDLGGGGLKLQRERGQTAGLGRRDEGGQLRI